MKSYIHNTFLLLMLICISFTTVGQQQHPAERFLAYYNNHQQDSLELLLSDDFVFNRSFVKDSLANKKKFLGSFMRYYTAFNSRYEILDSSYDGTTAIITALDVSDEVKGLQLTPAPWQLTIQSKDGKVTSFKMDATEQSGAYFKELVKQTGLFRKWAATKYTAKILNDIDGNIEIFHYMMEEFYDTHPISYHFAAKNPNIIPCSHTRKLLLKQRLALYPFNKAASVMLVSFNDTIDYATSISLEKRIPDFAAVPYKKKLSAADIDKLSDLLFNVGYVEDQLFKTQLITCSALKNAIVFLNAQGEPFEYIGTYGRCNILEYDESKIKLPMACDEKYYLLRRFFMERGLPVSGRNE